MAMAESDTGETMMVKEIHVYPFKSLLGLSLPSHLATYTGLQHDRRFMFQRVSTGANMTVAKETEMCLFSTHIPQSKKALSTTQTDHEDSEDLAGISEVEVRYTLSHSFNDPSHPIAPTPLLVPLNPSTSNLTEVPVTMYSSPTTGYDMGSHYNTWFSERFGYAVRLLYIGGNKRLVLGNMPPDIAGQQRENGTVGEGRGNTYEHITTTTNKSTDQTGKPSGWASTLSSTLSTLLPTSTSAPGPQKKYEGVDHGISFADVAPYLLTTTSSFTAIQSRLPRSSSSSLDTARFRPNILLSTPSSTPAFDEDYWAELRITNPTTKKSVEIVLTQNCARCNSLNVDYRTGKVGEGESGKVLAKLAGDRRVDGGAKWSGVFGRYGFLKRIENEGNEGEGWRISVGDKVEVIRRNEERTRFEWPNLSTDS